MPNIRRQVVSALLPRGGVAGVGQLQPAQPLLALRAAPLSGKDVNAATAAAAFAVPVLTVPTQRVRMARAPRSWKGPLT